MQLSQFGRRPSARALIATSAVAMLVAVGGCGGVTKFSDTTAIAIRGPAPEAPPPPPQKKRVVVTKDRIEISEKIQFELDQATIMEVSYSLLDEIKQVIADNPQIKKVDIVGHSSAEGDDNYNQKLSEKRAQAVLTYLTEHGIDAGRLTSKGLGETQPIADNETNAGREMNRRVEFIIVEQDLTGGAE